MVRARTVISGLVAAVAASLACGGVAVAAPASFTPGADFADVFDAALAGDRDHVSLIVAGREPGPRSDELAVRVYARPRGGRWAAAPALRAGLSHAGSPFVAQLGGAPCVGYERLRARRALTCLRGRRWVALPTAGAPSRGARLAAFWTAGGLLTAAFLHERGRDRGLTVLRLDGGRWRPLGPPLGIGWTVAEVAMPAAAGAPVDVVLADQRSGDRTIWTLADGAWRRQPPLTGVGVGPQPSGPVRAGRRVLLAVTDATRRPWTFSVHALAGGRWSRVGGKLSRGPGNAQGVLRAAGGSVWALWQEHAPRPSGDFDTCLQSQEVHPALRPPRRLWSGVSLGPGDLDTVVAAGRRWVLSMPTGADGQLTVRVRSVP